MATRRTPKTAPSSPAPRGAAPVQPTSRHIRPGIGDPAMAEVLAWTDAAYARATTIIDRAESVRELAARGLHEAYRAMLQMRALDAAAQGLVADGTIGSYVSTKGVEAAVAG